jgi:WD40 repeat protein
VNQVAWSPDGRYLAAGYNGANGTAGVTIWNVRTGLVVQTFADHGIDEISWSPNGKYFAVSSDDPTQSTDPTKTVIWKTANWQSVLTLKGSEASGTPWSPDSTRLALSGSDIQIVSIPAKKVILTYTGQSNEYNRSLAWSPDGKRIVSAGTETIQIWNSTTGQHLFTYPGQSGTPQGNPALGPLSWSPDGKYIASSENFGENVGGGGTVKVWLAE